MRAATLIVLSVLLSGCAAVQVAMVGAGKDATAENTGFLGSYQGLASIKDQPSLPDLSYISPRARIGSYQRVIVTDLLSMATDIKNLRGLQVRQYKTIKQELADQIATSLDGTTFPRVTRMSERLDPKDTAAIKRLSADAVLMGNIKELVSLGGENRAGLTAIQIEYKLVDVKTGEEVITGIHRSTTDLDKVAMAQVRVLGSLFNKAKASSRAMDGGPTPVLGSAPAPSTAANPSVTAKATSESEATMSPKEVQERLNAMGYSVGKPDGSFGPRSTAALRKFQQDKGLPVTGAIDVETIRKLRGT